MTGLNGVIGFPTARRAFPRLPVWAYVVSFEATGAFGVNGIIPLTGADPTNDYAGALSWYSWSRYTSANPGDWQGQSGHLLPPLLATDRRDVSLGLGFNRARHERFTQSGLFSVHYDFFALGDTSEAVTARADLTISGGHPELFNLEPLLFRAQSLGDTEVSVVGSATFRAIAGVTHLSAILSVDAPTLSAPEATISVTFTRLGD